MSADLGEEVKQVRDYRSWKPVPHGFVKDPDLRYGVHQQGLQVRDWLSEQQLQSLKELYHRYHELEVEQGGMFYSLYSRDLEYRQAIHNEILSILQPVLTTHFSGYRNVINMFVVKASGPESEFYVHQDTSALDEFHHSPLSLWIPLQDVDVENGCLGVIEKTHWTLSPIRGVTFPFAFQAIEPRVRDFLKPVPMKAGEVLLLDSRVIHNSMANQSGKDRLAIVCGLFPEDADFQTYWRNPEENDSIEVWQHDPDYLLRYPNFLYGCHERPVSGAHIKTISQDFEPLTQDEFERFCALNNIKEGSGVMAQTNVGCHMIGEPDGLNRPHG